jgi:hypothetical protein
MGKEIVTDAQGQPANHNDQNADCDIVRNGHDLTTVSYVVRRALVNDLRERGLLTESA